MAGDLLFAKHLGQAGRDTLGKLARVDEDERCAMRLNEVGDPPINLVPLLVRAHRRQRRGRNLDGDIHRAAMTDIYEIAFAPNADEEAGHLTERLLRRGESN